MGSSSLVTTTNGFSSRRLRGRNSTVQSLPLLIMESRYDQAIPLLLNRLGSTAPIPHKHSSSCLHIVKASSNLASSRRRCAVSRQHSREISLDQNSGLFRRGYESLLGARLSSFICRVRICLQSALPRLLKTGANSWPLMQQHLQRTANTGNLHLLTVSPNHLYRRVPRSPDSRHAYHQPPFLSLESLICHPAYHAGGEGQN